MAIRRYGQHFLTDGNIIRKIVEGSGVTKKDAVLEIGPGRGILTRALADAAAKVLTVEIDRRLQALLVEEGLPANVELVRASALDLEADALAASLGADWKLVANLPYEITTKTLERFLPMRAETGKGPTSITLMLQKEVAERITAKPGDMNRLAAFCGYYAVARVLFDVPPGAFSPPPKVRSCVIRLDLRPEVALSGPQEALFFRLLSVGFSEKRRQLKNTLASVLGPDAAGRLRDAGLRPEARPEETSLEQWITLAQRM
ncbi:MAG TPA: 16S rRNA (adenine(1518)-N(6)/adenine(1519)-N(6))-dimethyltransferase RsmA [Candidatus Baltobacteraceae bacterium]|nr:16S rRNA (adenine(1518)-N(6)/adenine(1519)-N(6))-dimethyltransferase RsmA [Candidatus Baltobacteraceae bacterium]